MAASLPQTAQPLYSLDKQAFENAVCTLASRALPGFSVGYRDEPDNADSSLVPLKGLHTALAYSGPAGSCPSCRLNVLEGCMVDICLACGAKGHSSGMTSQLQWTGSYAQHLFLQSIPYKASRVKRRSSGAPPRFSPTAADMLSGFVSSPTASSHAGGSASSAESPWNSAMDTGFGDSIFSLADAAAEMSKQPNAQPRGMSSDGNVLDDFFAQLGGVPGSGTSRPAQAKQDGASNPVADPVVQAILASLPDLSFLLADRLMIPCHDPGNFPPKVPAVAPMAVALNTQTNASAVASADPEQDEWGDFE